MFTKQQQVVWVELEDQASAKRYAFPNELSILQKLHLFLQQYPHVQVKLHGMGTITSDGNVQEAAITAALKDVPSKVDVVFDITMPTHPDIQSNIARYSKELIDAVMNVEAKPAGEPGLTPMPFSGPLAPRKRSLADQFRQQMATQQPGTSLGSADLTSSFKAQMAANKEAPRVDTYPPGTARPPVAAPPQGEGETFDFEDYICKYAEELHEQNMEILDIVRAMGKMLAEMKFSQSAPTTGEITGELLRQWYAEAAGKVGFDKAFELLAEKLRGEEAPN